MANTQQKKTNNLRRKNLPSLVKSLRHALGGGGFAIPVIDFLTFHLPLDNSGISQLPTTLTINNTDVEPEFFYRGQDATVSEWVGVVGPTLTRVGSNLPTLNIDTPFLDDTKAVRAENTAYNSGDMSFANATTEDLVFVCVFSNKHNALMQNKNGGAFSASGWMLIDIGGANMSLYLSDGTNQTTTTMSGIVEGENIIFIGLVDRDLSTGMRIYRNGTFFSSGNPTAIGSIASPDYAFRMLAGTGTQGSLFAMWKRDNWFDGTTASMDAVAREITAKLTGYYPDRALGNPLPTLATRASAAYIPITKNGITKFHYVGSHWMRVGSQLEADGVTVANGYLSENSRSQVLAYTDDLTQIATWVPTLATMTLAADIDAPILGEPVHLLTADEGDDLHQVSQSIASAAGVVSVMVKQHPSATQNTFTLGSNSATHYVSLDFTTGIATRTGATAGGVVPLGNGWYWVWIRHSAVENTRLQAGSGSYDQVGSSPEVYIQAPQRESVNDIPTSYIPNRASSGTVTRAADRLRFKMDDGNMPDAEIATTVDISSMVIDSIAPSNRPTASITKAAHSANSIFLGISTNNVFYTTITSSEGANTIVQGGSDTTVGRTRTARFRLDGLNVVLHNKDFGESVSGTLDGPGPNTLAVLDVGCREVGILHALGLVSAIKIYNRDEGEP